MYGILHGHRDAGPVAERSERLGRRARSPSWECYEVGTTWCEVELGPTSSQDVLLNGVVDPSRFDDLAAALTRRGATTYTLELDDEDGNLLREAGRGG
ncbi:hypothetical protein ROS62_15560 [Streptomyces sp. DSM 41972]|uniref:Uncharacterized protein n=1 Tax=Streptomyces althioticus subsp. attaecolombicae TaxID=3075534 RepID=A0ABU3HZU4_9ACTN|nr:hypothetical protein [Streptomyces sp. DSM 41972]SCD33402.1 hypothetical protein GA0115238_103132 [Streptomyces sp. di50b]SCD35202.1 hypothetical protein GA0115245_103426 [Streptomyces sp. di188]